MLSMGDELGRTQRGNNNAYAQDNAASWIDWARADRDLAAFVARLARPAPANTAPCGPTAGSPASPSTRAAFPTSSGAIPTGAR